MRLDPHFLTHTTQGEHYTVSTTGTRFNGMIRSNPTAALIIEALKEETTEDAIVGKILAQYDVDRETASRDVAHVLDQLRGIGVLVE
ncbi:MAG: PqqD family protein [Oscillospiraceae bacterium]|nr:PqqD family protein [Oscillospiraceae bacterium]